MGKDGLDSKSRIRQTLSTLKKRNETPKVWYPVLLLSYILASVFVILSSARPGEMTVIGNIQIPLSAFTGVFSSLANILIIMMVILYRKTGFITALVILLFQFPMLLINILVRHNYISISGLFTNAFSIIAVIVIYINNKMSNKYQDKVGEQAVTDMLTGLPNRFAASEIADDLIDKGARFALVSIDISNFKSINDTLGFKAGNAALHKISQRWAKIADEGLAGTYDFIARQSGDEFILLIRDYKGEKQIIETVTKYKEALERKLTVEECDLFLNGSFGIAEYPVDSMTKVGLLSCAVAARYEVTKQNSSERIVKFTADMLKTEHTLEIEHEIRSALEKDLIYFNLQPQYNISHKLVGFEALARMKDKDGNNISPADFIPVAEKAGLIDKVDSTVFRKSALFFGDLMRRSGADLSLSINVSVRHLMKNGFFDELKSIIDDSGISPDRLEIEITESIMIDSAEKALRCIARIKEMGIRIAIDDFGTGYSSLSYLHKFPADLLKVDKSFVDKMNQSESSKDYVASIISIGHIMNFSVIAEGVEEQDQIDTLSDIGCDMIQGFVWGRPMDQEDIEKLVMDSVSDGK